MRPLVLSLVMAVGGLLLLGGGGRGDTVPPPSVSAQALQRFDAAVRDVWRTGAAKLRGGEFDGKPGPAKLDAWAAAAWEGATDQAFADLNGLEADVIDREPWDPEALAALWEEFAGESGAER